MGENHMTVSWPYAASQIKILESFGYSKTNAFEILGVDKAATLPDPALRITAQKFNKVFDAAEAALNDPLIGLRVGYEFRISNFATTGNIYSYCQNLTEVLALNARYQPLAVKLGRISSVSEPDENGDEPRYYLDYDLYSNDFDSVRHVFGLIFGAYGTAFRWLTWSSAYDLKAVYLQHKAPDDMSLYERVFQCPVYFNQPYNRIEFFKESMTAMISTYDPVRKAQAVAKLDSLMNKQDAHDSFKRSLYVTIQDEMARGRTNLQSIADSFGLSEHKFRQKLKRTSIKYRAFLDHVRQDLCEQKFSEGLGYAQIAHDLGYNDQAAFTRAFKRWHGVTPGEFTAKTANKNKALAS